MRFDEVHPSIRQFIYFVVIPGTCAIIDSGYGAAVLTCYIIMYNLIPEVWYLVNQRPFESYLPAVAQILGDEVQGAQRSDGSS